ncbi:hypothetical protein X942_6035 [Burkholderia pseudomallei MSHR5596]|nr:hypothetical protein X989_5882 [Burkholderia pseudomallei MSHR4378]KGS72650.1 hypothetical protein X942_6035 [Burkholderia pseudomallei MSHR5596]KGS73285.1 hypothetical protein X947_5864 [Burkholderia pseudomallei MSHR7334]KGW37910.1 hypothetical protein Y047_6179 [Burkholderia pseudomallei MSHR3016]
MNHSTLRNSPNRVNAALCSCKTYPCRYHSDACRGSLDVPANHPSVELKAPPSRSQF